MSIKVGVIGAGKWGINHLRIFSKLNNLVALSDIDEKKKKVADKYNIIFFDNYKEMLKEVDAISVVAPTDKHYEVVKECLLQGKHVFVEKPITNDSKQAQELVELAKTKNLILNVGYLFRFNAAVKKLKEELKNIGNLQYITMKYIHSNKPPRKDSGVILNFAVHLIDILNFLIEKKPKKIYCKKFNYLSDEREDAAFITLDYEDFIANLEVSWFHPLKKREIWIIASKEKIYADLLEQIVIKYPIEINLDRTKAEKEINLEIRKNEPLEEELIHFCKCVEENNKNLYDEIINIGEEEYYTTKICELALESAKTGKEVLL